MTHIVFQPADVDALKKSFDLDPDLAGDILCIQDDYAVGPIDGIYTTEGIENRLQWWKNILADGPYEGIADDGHVHDNEDVQQLKQMLDEQLEEVVWIWAAQNKHDVCGYYWLMSQLKDYQGRIFILYLNNLPFLNDKGNLFYPTALFQIPPKEFVKAKKLARPITLSEFEVDPDEWLKLMTSPPGIRLLEGGKKLIQKGYDYYDAELLKFISKDWQRTSKIFQQYFGKAKETTGDAFLVWRLKQLAEQEHLSIKGNVKNIKEMEVRLQTTEPAEVQEN